MKGKFETTFRFGTDSLKKPHHIKYQEKFLTKLFSIFLISSANFFSFFDNDEKSSPKDVSVFLLDDTAFSMDVDVPFNCFTLFVNKFLNFVYKIKNEGFNYIPI